MRAVSPGGRPSGAPRSRREDGVVLFLVLILIATTVGAVYAFARVSILGISSAQQRMNRMRAEVLARSSLDIAIRALRDDGASDDPLRGPIDSDADAWAVLTREPIEPEPGITVQFSIRDAGQRIDLNALLDPQGAPQPLSAQFLRDALDKVIENMPGRKEEKNYETPALADAILDWIDSDDVTRLGGGEAEFYKEKRAERLPLDRPLLTLAELEGIPGLDERLLEAMDAYFAPSLAYPRSGGRGGINPNTAPAYILAMLYLTSGEKNTRFVEEDDVDRLLRIRGEGRPFCPSGGQGAEQCSELGSELGETGTIFPPVSLRSEEFAIEVEARVDETRACVGAVFSRRPKDEGGGLLSYRLGC